MATTLLTPDQARARFEGNLEKMIREVLEKNPSLTSDDAETRRQEALKSFDERMAKLVDDAEPPSDMSLPGSANADAGTERAYEISRAIRGLALQSQGDSQWVKNAGCERELEMSRELQNRDHGMVDDVSAAFLVPTEVHDELFEELLRPAVIAFQLGVQRLSVSGSPILIPMETETMQWEDVAENEGGNDSDVGFGEMALTPKACQASTKISRDLLMSSPGIEGFIRGIIARELGQKMNRNILTGTGGPNAPVGLMNTPGVMGIDFSGVSITKGNVPDTLYTTLLEMVYAVQNNNAMVDGGSFGWAIPTRAMQAFEQMRSSDPTAGNQLEMTRNVLSAGSPTQILGYTFAKSNILGAGADAQMLFGDYSKAIYAEWGGMRIEASNVAEDCFRKNKTLIVARTRGDLGVTRPEAIVQSNGFDLTNL